MAYSERLLENQERLSMRDMRLRVAKLILRGVASSTIAQAEGYPSYTARELSSYFSYSSISIVVNLNLNYYYYYYYYYFKPRVAPRHMKKKFSFQEGS